jgi:Tfp pilus assembly protein PilN
MFDINILPQRYRRRKITIWMVLPTILLLVLLAATYPAYQAAENAQTVFKNSRSALAEVQTTFNAFQINNADLVAIENEIRAESELRDQILSSYGGLQVSGNKWSPTLDAVVRSAPSGIQWLSISQQEGVIRLEGVSGSYDLLISLADSLEPISGIAEVEIGSVEEWLSEEEPPPLPSDDLEGAEEADQPQTPYAFVIYATLSGEVLP